MKDAVADNLVLVARIDVLIQRYGMDESILRPRAHAAMGADAILLRSRKSSADEIVSFARVWQHRPPVVIVPATYYRTPFSAYTDSSIPTVIWANHSTRAAIAAMRHVRGRAPPVYHHVTTHAIILATELDSPALETSRLSQCTRHNFLSGRALRARGKINSGGSDARIE